MLSNKIAKITADKNMFHIIWEMIKNPKTDKKKYC